MLIINGQFQPGKMDVNVEEAQQFMWCYLHSFNCDINCVYFVYLDCVKVNNIAKLVERQLAELNLSACKISQVCWKARLVVLPASRGYL